VSTTREDGLLDWGALVAFAVHPTKVGIAEALRWIGRPLSASEIRRSFGNGLTNGSITHHMRQMEKWGAVEDAGREPGARGAPMQLFVLTRKGSAR